MAYYKFLTEYARSPYQDTQWSSPRDGKPGAWVTTRGKLSVCGNGIHICRPEDLVYWLTTPCLWEVEPDLSDSIACADKNKVVCRGARLIRLIPTWNDDTMRQFAQDCIDHVRPICERRGYSFFLKRLPNVYMSIPWINAREIAWAAAEEMAEGSTISHLREKPRTAEREWQTTRLLSLLGIEQD